MNGKNSGFTLMEMMIAVAIFGLLLMMTLPNYMSQIPIRRLDAAAQQINANLQAARAQAMTEGELVNVTIGPSQYAMTKANGASVLANNQIPDLSAVTRSLTLGGAFNPDGSFATGSGASVQLSSAGSSEYRWLRVFASGQVFVSKTAF